jgi:hypothetical protein
MAYAGRVADGFKGIEEPGYPLIRGVNIVLGDIVPDAIQVPVGIIAQDTVSHFGFPALLGFTLQPRAGICRGDMLTTVECV